MNLKKYLKEFDGWTIIAMLFMIISIIVIFKPFYCFCREDWCIGVSITFATLSSVVLVFKTILIQIKSLQEEKHKNKLERFNSQFFAILSQWRNDALQIDFETNYLDAKLNGMQNHITAKSEKAFFIARKVFKLIYETLLAGKYKIFDYEVYIDEIKHEKDKLEYVGDNSEEYEKIKRNISNIIKDNHGAYLCSQFGINDNNLRSLGNYTDEDLKKYILEIIVRNQKYTFSKYLKSLNVIIKRVESLSESNDKKDYYDHIICSLGKEEYEFLKQCKLINF